MPFTLAHPVAVLPLRRYLGRYGVSSALVIGSTVPDLVYFLPFGDRSDSHSVPGVFTFCLPVGLATYAIYHLLIQPLMLAMLPWALRARLTHWPATPRLPKVSLPGVMLSLCLGAFTHVVWDGLTHRPVVSIAPSFGLLLFSGGGYRLFAYKILHHTSSVVGLLLLWHWARSWFERTLPRPEATAPLPRDLRMLIAALLFVPAAVIGLWVAWPILEASIAPARIAQVFVATVVIGGGRVFLLSTMLVAAALQLSRRYGPPATR